MGIYINYSKKVFITIALIELGRRGISS